MLGLQGASVKISTLFVCGAVLLSACSTTSQNTLSEPIDLIGDKKAVLGYWQVDERGAPEYPQQAKTQRISGCVEFALIIDSNGKAINPKIIKAFPEGVFNKQAMKAIKKWKWAPTGTNPDRQPVLTTIQHDFVVRESQNWKEAYSNCKI